MAPKKKKPSGKTRGPKRSPTERTADLLWLEREYLRGTRNPDRLASMLAAQRSYKIGRDQIRYDLGTLREGWREATKATYAEHIEKVLAELEEQERELWVAWEKSKKDEETESEKTKSTVVNAKADGIGGEAAVGFQTPVSEVEKGKKRVGQSGDPSYQRLILDIQIRRCKLLGLDRPQRVEVDHSGSIAQTVDVDSLNLPLETKKQLLEAVRAKKAQANGSGRV